MSFTPYLFFTGDCRAAMERYHEIFGGDLQVLTGADTPPDATGNEGPAMPPDLVMHAALVMGNGGLLLASDDPTTDDPGPKQGFRVNYSAADAGDAQRAFDALAEGGSVELPLGETFFSPAFGMCTDRFGIPWMIGVMAPG